VIRSQQQQQQQKQFVIARDTTIQCGLDGRVENNCTLNDGFIQVMLQTALPGVDGYKFGTGQDENLLLYHADLVLDNVTIKGLTFTGTMESDGTFDGTSVSVSQRGNVTFDDCVWRDMIGVHGVIIASLNSYQVWKGDIVPPHSIQVNVVRSSFINIVYDWYVKGEKRLRY
jgi:hypothetical protein